MDSENLPNCPVCALQLKAPGICLKCGPLRLYVVEQPRVRRLLYSREVWAPNEDVAIELVRCGTAWPDTYDERTLGYTEGEYAATEKVAQSEYRKREVGFPNE